ncbi:BREX-1 system adenine-specific DNA-methyltransferase PglX [Photobacterium damselae subsp. damselae]|nr:BREX-1 system adenine-specific DNA-methyltransferase PglX [Photobacterium damselae subsp. damselae]UKA23906.1 BREX-1 system adenine-specific DNA-methyltransferase PglX [Photobacterium damselae subsp. damselae]
MLTIGDGSTHTHLGDSVRKHLWNAHYPELQGSLSPDSFTCIVTNLPFGKGLKVSKSNVKAAGLTITRKLKKEQDGTITFSKTVHEEREIGIIFLERCYELLATNGRLGIILLETYMFSPSYSWLRYWLKDRLELRAMLNIPMEAFQGFCRDKTNFCIFEKVGK